MEQTLHVHADNVPAENADRGITRQILGYLPNLMLVKVHFAKGAVGRKHSHVHEQVSYVVSGVFEVEIDGKKEILKAGDAFVIPAGLEHGAVCLEDGVLIDTFSPMREDFLS